MELLKLSKFKLQLQTLITEFRELKERERSATEQLRLLNQKQKQTEEEYGRKLQELQAELASSNEQRQKLERKVSYLQNDNALLENKQKELKGTIQCLLQSKESFVNAYEEEEGSTGHGKAPSMVTRYSLLGESARQVDKESACQFDGLFTESTCEMKRSIETRDRKLTVLSEKINSHLLLFDSIEKEAFSIKHVVNDVQCLLNEKEEVVAGLRSKLDKVSTFEKVFVGKIHYLENKLKNDEDELRRKDRIISELEAHLEAERASKNYQTQIEEISVPLLRIHKTLSAKDVVIQNLVSEKEALHSEVGSLGIILQKIQETVTNMNQEDKRVFSSILECQERCNIIVTRDDNRTEDVPQSNIEKSPSKASETGSAENTASPLSDEYKEVAEPLRENNNSNSCLFIGLFARSPQSACSEPQSAANFLSISVNDGKENHTRLAQRLDSECSTTQAEASEDPDNSTWHYHIQKPFIRLTFFGTQFPEEQQ
uniref:Uncharacterized protein n=1 Tax=Quercus lobata TaxID=97700 RepID=A0A7N2LC13_QUELO